MNSIFRYALPILLAFTFVAEVNAQNYDYMGIGNGLSWEEQIALADEGDNYALEIVIGNYADGHFGLRDYDKAIYYLNKKLAKSPDDAEALFMLAQVYDTMEESDKAQEYYRRGARLGNLAAMNMLALYAPNSEAIDWYRKVVKISRAADNEDVDAEQYAEALIRLSYILEQNRSENLAEIKDLAAQVKDPRVFYSDTYSCYLFSYIESHPGSATNKDGLAELLMRLTRSADGLSRLFNSSQILDSFKEASVKEVEKIVRESKASGGYSTPENEIIERDKVYTVASYLVEKKQYKRALPLMLYAAERGNIWAARDLAYFVYGKPVGDLIGGPVWPAAYRNAAKARKWKAIYNKFFYEEGQSGI